ncbi:hypothetical protein D9758_006181 [Tetrapyrgos nigripes]|uniref:Uncharacterized protein n=1 Tax=Tetrapyrgos nigripes TaxID=182062 RepID=A0A8H5LLD1_9AGAR|nr:hypothetical protein D9758_006181 [Tetrapyrgos nigripes]
MNHNKSIMLKRGQEIGRTTNQRPDSKMLLNQSSRVLITGGYGFLGSRIVARLSAMEAGFIRVADSISEPPHSRNTQDHEFMLGDLCDEAFCQQVVWGIDVVIHITAIIDGIGYICGENDPAIQDKTMTMKLLEACVAAGVKDFVYASSVRTDANSLLLDSSPDVSLRVSDIAFQPDPQGLYGLEKLNFEGVLHNLPSTMNIRIVRFHNIFGPNGAWRNGQENAPAAMLRKAFATKLLGDTTPPFELGGIGDQRCSFLYIEDAVDGFMEILQSGKTSPFDIRSDYSVSIKELADIALHHADVDPSTVYFKFDEKEPVVVASPSTKKYEVLCELGWTPKTSLEEGMRLTGVWIQGEMQRILGDCEDEEQRWSMLKKWTDSDMVDLALDSSIIFAILLPVTSRSVGVESCLSNLRQFARSLKETTFRDTHALGGTRFCVKVYLALDSDDELLYIEGANKACEVLYDAGIRDVITLIRDYPKGDVCSLWRDCAREAWKDGCHYMVLLGDDVVPHDEDWMRRTHSQFKQFSKKSDVPLGFGCVALTDISFPGIPTFPIIHRTHLDIFNGEVVPEVFINQGGDPYLFQLYRQWGCSEMIPSRISNRIGGEQLARYQKIHVQWTFTTLDNGVCKIKDWLRARNRQIQRQLMLDVVIPSYRVLLPVLERILNLKTSATCSVMFIIIVDDPNSPAIDELKNKYGSSPDVRIRVNNENLGASESRNRGMRESSAEWILFLDDDVMPNSDILVQAEKVIGACPNAAGFVGRSLFPPADNIFTTAVHLADVLYFWDIANKISYDVPWGVTANLIVPRRKDDIYFDPIFPKTGGGEDIDFCRKKRDYSLSLGGEGFRAAPEVIVTHPWWNEGKRSYWRFHMWSIGDGTLVKRYPEHCYQQWIPNGAEMVSLCVLVTLAALPFARGLGQTILDVLCLFFKVLLAIVLGNILHDGYRIYWRNPERYIDLNTSINGWRFFLAIIEGCFIRLFSEMGRLRGMIERKEYSVILRRQRFDWFAGHPEFGMGPIQEELQNGRDRVLMVVVLLFWMMWAL